MDISTLRRNYHQEIASEILRISNTKANNGYPNIADGSNTLSVNLAWGLTERITDSPIVGKLAGQTTRHQFELGTRNFLEAAFGNLTHLRPGIWSYQTTDTRIAHYTQYEHLTEIEEALAASNSLKAAFGGNYIVSPDIVISRLPISDDEINTGDIILPEETPYVSHSPFRAKNQVVERSLLHAVVSCKWTLRNDRAQNTKTEVLNLIRNRKGHLPHIVAVTAEPLPSRIAAMALGTGDLDCVYHFALHELIDTIKASPYRDAEDMLDMMVTGKRLRDISDLPFDLAV